MATVAVEPAESPVLSAGTTAGHRIEGIGIGFVPPLWHPSDATEVATVSSDEAQEPTSKRMARIGQLETAARRRDPLVRW